MCIAGWIALLKPYIPVNVHPETLGPAVSLAQAETVRSLLFDSNSARRKEYINSRSVDDAVLLRVF